MKTMTKLQIGIGALVLFTPLGLILPDHFKAGSAWGEWGFDEVKKHVGYLPHGLKKLGELWNAPIPDYAFQGWEGRGLNYLSIAYIVSGILGVAIVSLAVWFIGSLMANKSD